jgi:Bacteriophage baseplate protein W
VSTYLDFPFHIDGRRHTAETDLNDHIRDLLYQVLFCAPGERVNRPDFGCGIGQLVFMPNSHALAAATEFLVRGSLVRWLADVIAVQNVEVVAEDAALTVTIVYTERGTGTERTAQFLSPWSI